jgi:hypothetical protein
MACSYAPGAEARTRGEPKIPKVIQGILDRGLVEIRRNAMGRQAAFFMEAGLEALRQLLQDRRAMDPERFAHLRQELGMEPWSGSEAWSHKLFTGTAGHRGSAPHHPVAHLVPTPRPAGLR